MLPDLEAFLLGEEELLPEEEAYLLNGKGLLLGEGGSISNEETLLLNEEPFLSKGEALAGGDPRLPVPFPRVGEDCARRVGPPVMTTLRRAA